MSQDAAEQYAAHYGDSVRNAQRVSWIRIISPRGVFSDKNGKWHIIEAHVAVQTTGSEKIPVPLTACGVDAYPMMVQLNEKTDLTSTAAGENPGRHTCRECKRSNIRRGPGC